MSQILLEQWLAAYHLLSVEKRDFSSRELSIALRLPSLEDGEKLQQQIDQIARSKRFALLLNVNAKEPRTPSGKRHGFRIARTPLPRKSHQRISAPMSEWYAPHMS